MVPTKQFEMRTGQISSPAFFYHLFFLFNGETVPEKSGKLLKWMCFKEKSNVHSDMETVSHGRSDQWLILVFFFFAYLLVCLFLVVSQAVKYN